MLIPDFTECSNDCLELLVTLVVGILVIVMDSIRFVGMRVAESDFGSVDSMLIFMLLFSYTGVF